MSSSIKFIFISLILPLFLLTSCNTEKSATKTVEVRGVYGSPKPLWDKNLNLNDLGINAIFVRSQSIDQNMMDRAKSEGLKVFAEFATLNGKNYVKDHPEAWAIDEMGEQVEAATWFMGVCPTEPGFRQYRYNQLRDLLLKYDLNGVWMDYVHWHAQFEDPEPILPETCFCDHCLLQFSEKSGIQIPEGTTVTKASWILNNQEKKWRDWRCQVIYDWASDMKGIIQEIRPAALLGLYHCPWDDHEFDGARRRILGLDYDILKETIDVFSPMVYHERMQRTPEWVKENILWFNDRLTIQDNAFPKVWPIVQASDTPHEEFKIVLEGGLAGKSSGVMMFTASAIANDTVKTEVLKSVYTKLRQEALK